MPYKILHTSDWHLGKKLFKKSRIPEQKLFLEWLLSIVLSKRITHLLISGDIFDIPNPPNEAINLYFDFLNQISTESDCIVIIIPGNHDSASFLSAPVQLLKKHNIYIKSGIENFTENNHLLFSNNDQSICIKTIPYFRSYELYNILEKNQHSQIDLKEVEDKIKSFINIWPTDLPINCKKIIMAHHAFGSPLATGSEQVLMLSGLEAIPLSWIEPTFDYMALGHIHRPQTIDHNKNIYYSGSPIPMRFSEKHDKSIRLIKWDNEKIEIEELPIPIFRPIIQLFTSEDTVFSDLEKIKSKNSEYGLDSFIEINIKMNEPNNQLADQIEEYIKNLNIQLLSFLPEYTSDDLQAIDETISVHHRNIRELFEIYYLSKYPDTKEIPEKLVELFLQNLEEINHENSLTQD